MNNTINSIVYTFVAGAAIATGTADAMEDLSRSIIVRQETNNASQQLSSPSSSINKEQSGCFGQTKTQQRSPAQQLINSTNAFKKTACELLEKQEDDVTPLLTSMQRKLNRIIRITKEQSSNENSQRVNLLNSIKITNKAPIKETIITWLNILEDVNAISFSQEEKNILENSTLLLNNPLLWYHNNLSSQLQCIQNISSNKDTQNYLLQILWWNACNQNDCIKNIEYISDIENKLQINGSCKPKTFTNKSPEILPLTIDDLDSIKNLPRHIQKIVLRDQLKQFVNNWRNKLIAKNLANLTKYLSILIKYKNFVTEENNLNELNKTIEDVEQKITKLKPNNNDVTNTNVTPDTFETDVKVDEDALTSEFRANNPLGTNSTFTITQPLTIDNTPLQSINDTNSTQEEKKESDILLEQKSDFVPYEPEVPTEQPTITLNDLLRSNGQPTFSTIAQTRSNLPEQVAETDQTIPWENQQTQVTTDKAANTLSILQAQEAGNVGQDNCHHNSEENIQNSLTQNSPDQSRPTSDTNTTAIAPIKSDRKDNGAGIGPLPNQRNISSSSSSSSSDDDTRHMNQAPQDHSLLPKEEQNKPINIDHQPQEESTGNYSGMWNYIASSIASAWNSLWNIFAWLKFW